MLGNRRDESPQRRTAANRPRPWKEETPPFSAGRFEIEAYRAHRQVEEKAAGAPPRAQCLRLQEIYPCPLLAHRWQDAEIKGGIRLSVHAGRRNAHRLRDALRCHAGYSRPEERQATCLGRFADAQMSGGYADGQMWLQLLSRSRAPAAISDLRRRVRALIAEAQ